MADLYVAEMADQFQVEKGRLECGRKCQIGMWQKMADWYIAEKKIKDWYVAGNHRLINGGLICGRK